MSIKSKLVLLMFVCAMVGQILSLFLVLMTHFHFPVPLGGVRDLRISDSTFTTLTATWDAADGNVQGYKVIYVPTDGGPELVVQFCHFCPQC